MTPRVVFLNPWDRLIGPNRYLADILAHAPELAATSAVIFDRHSDAVEEYAGLGCAVAVWPEARLIHPHLTVRNFVSLLGTHTIGLARGVRLLRQLDPDVVVSNTENLWAGGLVAAFLRVPHAQIVHALTFQDRLERWPILLRGYLAFLLLPGTHFVAVSHAVAAALRRGGIPRQSITVIPNPIPLASLPARAESPQPAGFSLPANRFPVVVCAGRLSPMKGQDVLVEALPAIRSRYPGLLCVLAGRVGSPDGLDDTHAFEQRIRQRVHELGLDAHVRFAGEVDPLLVLLRAADLYVQPSRTESFGRVVAEALACGVPVVAFATGGIPEAAGPGALLVSSGGGAAALADAMLEALDNPLSSAGRVELGQAHVREHFDPSLVAARFAHLVEQIACSTRD